MVMSDAFLSSYRLPVPAFDRADRLPPLLRPLWEALRHRQPHVVLRQAPQLLEQPELENADLRAALLSALGAARLQVGQYEGAKRMLRLSLAALPQQWLARRLLVACHERERHFAEAQACLAELAHLSASTAWDEPLPPVDWHLGMAALAWHLRDWESVSWHVSQAFPKGLETMPSALQADLLRVALYRNRPDEACRIAARLMMQQPDDQAIDVLLETLVQRGWKTEACALYREAYRRYPESERLRRRLVALCLQTGAIEEARRLTRQGALTLE